MAKNPKKPVLLFSDKRVQKHKFTHAALCCHLVTKELRLFNLDNIPEKWLHWKPIRVVEARISGKTISETIAILNKELKSGKYKLVPKTKVSDSIQQRTIRG